MTRSMLMSLQMVSQLGVIVGNSDHVSHPDYTSSIHLHPLHMTQSTQLLSSSSGNFRTVHWYEI